MLKTLLKIGTVTSILVFVGSIFKPVPIVSEDKLLSVEGVVKSIYEGGVKDVVFILEDHETKYYINRGLEVGLDLQDLQNNLIGQSLVLKYPKYWTPLDPNDKIKHVSKVYLKNGTNEEVVFSEVD